MGNTTVENNTNSSKSTGIYWILGIFGSAIIFLFILQQTIWKATWLGDLINLICGLASVCGVFLAFVQIKQAQQQIDHTQTEIETVSKTTKVTQAKIQKVLAISDLAKANESINIIYSHLKQREYDLAHHRILEINSLIIEIKEMPSLRTLETVKTLEAHGKYLAADLLKLQKSIIVDKKDVDNYTIEAILKSLNEISNAISKLTAQLKHKEDE